MDSHPEEGRHISTPDVVSPSRGRTNGWVPTLRFGMGSAWLVMFVRDAAFRGLGSGVFSIESRPTVLPIHVMLHPPLFPRNIHLHKNQVVC